MHEDLRHAKPIAPPPSANGHALRARALVEYVDNGAQIRPGGPEGLIGWARLRGNGWLDILADDGEHWTSYPPHAVLRVEWTDDGG